MKKGLLLMLFAGVLCAGFYMLAGTQGILTSPAYASPDATARAATMGGSQVGELLIDDQVALRIRTSAGGLTPFQRAQVVANRINQLMGDTLQPEDITMGVINGQQVVMADSQVIVTADAQHARLNNTTPAALSTLWARQIANAVSGRPLTETRVGEKIVPIISVGSGTRVGGALVTGASSRLDEVVAVAQIEGQFGSSVRVRALVPVSTENVVQNIRRVPQTSVIGLVDIRL